MLLSLLLLTAQGIIPADEFRGAGYVAAGGPSYNSKGGGALFTLPDTVRDADDRRITVKFTLFDEVASETFRSDRELEKFTQLALSNFQKEAPSRYPIGTDVLYRDDLEVVNLRARSSRERVDISMVEPRGVSNRSVAVIPSNRAAQIVLIEKVARQVLARSASRRLGSSLESFSLNDRAVRYLTKVGTTERFVDLDDWQLARGFSETFDEKTQVSVMRRGSLEIIFPLASSKVLVNGARKALTDITMQRDGRWYVPLVSLESFL